MTKSVVLKPDGSWSVYVGKREVPKACNILSQFSSPLLSNSELLSLIKYIDRATICPGNPEEKFVTICQMRGGSIKGARGNGDTIAFVDNSSVVDSTGKGYSCTVRRVDCDVICEHTGQYPLRCKECQTFRSTLRASVSRQKGDSHDHTSAGSHTHYCILTPAEKDERLRNLHYSLQRAKQKVKRLEARVTQLIKSQSIPLQECDNEDISTIVADLSPTMEDKFPPDSPRDYSGISKGSTTVLMISDR